MADRARVHAIGALADFRRALVTFGEEVSAALISAEADAGRTVMRIRSQWEPHWKKQIRERTDELQRAKSELVAKQATSAGEAPRSTVDERKAVERAKRRVKEAEEKHAATKRWARRLEKEQDRFRGGVQALRSLVAAELPRGVADLERMQAALEAYAAIAVPKRDEAEDGGGTGSGAGP